MVDAGKSDHHAIPHHHAPIPRRQIVAQVIVGAVILVSGIAIGGGGTILALKDRIVPIIKPHTPVEERQGQDPEEGGRRAEWIVKRWTDEYGLSNEQIQRAKDTLTKEFAATDRLWEEFRKAEDTQRNKFIQAMKGIFTPEQFTKWEADFKRMVEHMQRMRPFDPRRGGPPGDRRPEWRPDRPRDPNGFRGDRPPGPPRDPNGPRGDGRFGRRGDRPRERSGDPNDPRGVRPPDWPSEPNAGRMPPEPR